MSEKLKLLQKAEHLADALYNVAVTNDLNFWSESYDLLVKIQEEIEELRLEEFNREAPPA